MNIRMHEYIRVIVLCGCAALIGGCAGTGVVMREPPQKVYPDSTPPDAPLVLAIPGLWIPGTQVTQEQQFGRLVEMLAREGIPSRIVAYDTAENPLPKEADIFSPDLAIAWTRVGPGIVREVKIENERRGTIGLPPVKKIVLIGASQGGVIMEQIARRVFYEFPKQVEKVLTRQGVEWDAIRNDPQFTSFIEALEDFLVIKNIRVQREKGFMRDYELRHFYARSEKRVRARFDGLLQYLIDPSVKYPDVPEFEEPGSPKYPKKYHTLKDWAVGLSARSPEDREEMRQFFVNYAEYRDLLGVTPYFFSAAGSFFGSPRANEAYSPYRWRPLLKLFAGRELNQIMQTQLGTSHHMESIEDLVRLSKDARYPIAPPTTLFVVGANGSGGDGIIDQSSAHLSDHSYTLIRVEEPPGADGAVTLTMLEETRLPDLVVVPLPIVHYPATALQLMEGARYGAAYMEPGNPVFPCLLSFIRDDWRTIHDRIEQNHISLRQFMLELAFPGEKGLNRKVRQVGRSRNVRVDGLYYNPDSNTVVWTGHFSGPGQEMILDGAETVSGTMRLDLELDGHGKVPLACTVYPGCNSFVKLTR